jgi:hypothetical protein
MPAYFNRQSGKRVTQAEATIDGSKLRDGFFAVVEDGEVVRMSVGMFDSQPGRSSVFLTDQGDASQVNLEVAKMRASHVRKFAFMGDRAPAFDEDKARLAAAGKVQTYNAQVADAARFANVADDPAVAAASRQRAYNKSTAYKGDRNMRDHARSNRY